MKKQETLHYLKVLQKSYGIFQPEIRVAIDKAMQSVEREDEE